MRAGSISAGSFGVCTGESLPFQLIKGEECCESWTRHTHVRDSEEVEEAKDMMKDARLFPVI
jgi:hypothetical protein